MSKWSRSVGSIDEAQIEQMRKVRSQQNGSPVRNNGNNKNSKQNKALQDVYGHDA